MVSGPVRRTSSCCKRGRRRPSPHNQVNVAIGRDATVEDGTLERIFPSIVAFDAGIWLRQAGIEIVEPVLIAGNPSPLVPENFRSRGRGQLGRRPLVITRQYGFLVFQIHVGMDALSRPLPSAAERKADPNDPFPAVP